MVTVFRLLLLTFLCLGPMAAPSNASSAKSSVAVLQSQYGKVYASRLVAITGMGGQPEPKAWHLFAYDLQNPSLISHFVVTGEKITEAVMLDPERSKKWAAPVLAWEEVAVDTKKAFEIADKAARLALVGFDSLDFRLMSDRRTRKPVYQLELKDAKAKVVGYLRISAISGEILSQNWTGKPGVQMPWSGEEKIDWDIVKEEMSKVGRGIGGAFRKLGNNVRDQFKR